MKNIALILLYMASHASVQAGNPYRNYLVSRISNTTVLISQAPDHQLTATKSMAIPRYRIPAGSVFCRLEDKLTRTTKIWIKIGVK